MQLTNYLEAEQILVGCEVRNKEELLERMVDALLQSRVNRLNANISREQLLAAIRNREDERATGMEMGLAFPHARIPDFRGVAMALAILKNPISFGDKGSEVRFVCMMVVSADAPMLTLRVMSRVANFFLDDTHRHSLLSASSSEEVVRLLSNGDLSLDIPVTARDIMEPPGAHILESTPLRDVSRILHLQNLSVVPVVSSEGCLVGEVTCDILFQFGLPDFFHQLKSVSFISEFDPFEKYFLAEAHSEAVRVMNTAICIMPPEATLLEIVFALAVKKVSQVYIVDSSKKWIGVVDRDDVLNNVLNW